MYPFARGLCKIEHGRYYKGTFKFVLELSTHFFWLYVYAYVAPGVQVSIKKVANPDRHYKLAKQKKLEPKIELFLEIHFKCSTFIIAGNLVHSIYYIHKLFYKKKHKQTDKQYHSPNLAILYFL